MSNVFDKIFSSSWHKTRFAFQSKLGGNILALYVVQGMNYLAPIAILPYLLRTVGPRNFGGIVFAQSVIGYLRIWTDFGFTFTATREISIARNDPARVARIFWSTLISKVLLLIIGACVFSTIILLIPFLRLHLAFIAVSSMSALGAVLMPQWYFQGHEQMRFIATVQASSRVLLYGAIFLVVHTPRDALIAAGFLSAPSLVAAIVCLAGIPRLLPVKWIRPSSGDIRATLGASWYLFLSGAATSLYLNTNVFLIGLIGGDYQVALYGIANRLALAIFGLLSPISQAVYPRASLIFSRSRSEGKLFLKKLTGVLMGLALAMSFGIFIFAPLIIHIFGGNKFVGAVSVLRVMAALPILLALATILSQFVMINVGLTKQLSRIYIAAGITSLASLVTLVKYLGALGGAISLLLAEAIGPALMLLVIRNSKAALFQETQPSQNS